jgi:hypothetical protein
MKSFLWSLALVTSALKCIEVTVPCERLTEGNFKVLVLSVLTACPGTMRWLNCALVNSMWLIAVFLIENLNNTTTTCTYSFTFTCLE